MTQRQNHITRDPGQLRKMAGRERAKAFALFRRFIWSRARRAVHELLQQGKRIIGNLNAPVRRSLEG